MLNFNLASLILIYFIWLIVKFYLFLYLTKFLFFILEDFLLEDPKNYRFLTCGGLAVPGVDDAAEFRNTASAMSIMGLSSEDLSGMYL